MPKKDLDYSKIKAFAQSIIECIGDDNDVGEDPELPKQKPDKGSFNDIGSTDTMGDNPSGSSDPRPVQEFIGKELADKKDEQGESWDSKKKKKDSSLAMMGSMLASRINK